MDKFPEKDAAYQCGYKDGYNAAKAELIPCKIGDKVFGLRRYGDQRLLKTGRVTSMFYNENMELVISAYQITRGIWGKHIFATVEEARAALAEYERRKA